jgi:hypothetical protein
MPPPERPPASVPRARGHTAGEARVAGTAEAAAREHAAGLRMTADTGAETAGTVPPKPEGADTVELVEASVLPAGRAPAVGSAGRGSLVALAGRGSLVALAGRGSLVAPESAAAPAKPEALPEPAESPAAPRLARMLSRRLRLRPSHHNTRRTCWRSLSACRISHRTSFLPSTSPHGVCPSKSSTG